MRNKFTVCLFVVSSLFVASCETITPKMVADNMTVVTPEGVGPFPVVIYFQGTGGHNRRQHTWARWFKKHGVASAIVHNANIRKRSENPSGSVYTEDAAIAWDLLKGDARIDANRFAIMGFSRGGGMSLTAGHHFGGERAIPDFVFALYPGGYGPNWCSHSHDNRSRIDIFFGDKDDVGSVEGLLGACRSLGRSQDNVTYHEIPGATHGYDDIYGYSFGCCNPYIRVRVSPNPEAVAYTRKVILGAVNGRWTLPKAKPPPD